MAHYDAEFFSYVSSGAITSAQQLLPLVIRHIPAGSVLDVGCGLGAWLSVWQSLGVSDITGIDGDYVDRSKLMIDEKLFRPHDLVKPLDLGRQYDIAQSLEVAEHLPESSADTFVASLVRHSRVIVFSAAPKGQGGDRHVNEQPYDYWKKKFDGHGYSAIDCLRPMIAGNLAIEPWYRFNTFLYAHDEALSKLPPELLRYKLAPDEKPADISPLTYRLRKGLVRLLPVPAATRLAKIKERFVTRVRDA